MKIFCVLGGMDYEGSTLLGVFSTQEKAEEALKYSKRKNSEWGGYDDYTIAEWEVDGDQVCVD